MPDQTLRDIALEAKEATRVLQRFVKYQETQARRRFVFITLVAIPISMFISGLITMGVSTECFLSRPNQDPSWCQIMPGYQAAEDRDKAIIREFRDLQKRFEENERRLRILEEKVP